MSDAKPPAKLERLRRLLADFSFTERRRPGMLDEIDGLLRWALSEVVAQGMRAEEVRAALGPPHGMVGEESEDSHQWLYPSVSSAAEAAEAPEWFFALRFEHGLLRSVERRGWMD